MGSYALIYANKGHISFDVQDIYEPDGRVTAHIDPPEPIQEAFQLGTWRLRDANWDSDFPTAAGKIEWFMEKANITNVDGIIGSNLIVFEELVKLIEPIRLADYNETITSDNLWEKAQYYAQADFFPGSKQKREFLSDLQKEVLNNLQQATFPVKIRVLALGVRMANEKQLLFSFHNNKIGYSLEQLNWTGAVRRAQDSIFLVEANLGVNKSNCCLERNTKVDVTVDGNIAHHVTTLTIKNNSSRNAENPWGGKYHAWVRLLAAGQELGQWLDVPEQETRSVTFEYDTMYTGNKYAPYTMLIQKQSGIHMFPVDITFTRNGKTRMMRKDIVKDETIVL